MDRKQFFYTTSAFSSTLFLPGIVNAGSLFQENRSANLEDPEPYKPEIVKEFVIAGHSDLAKVQSMIKDYPNLIHGKIDWGNGDFESAIEGAGHMGNKQIAEFLIETGARVSLFVLTMLGKTDLVKPILEAYPKLIFANGPHGFSLLHHAQKGGKDGEALSTYLQEKGLTKTWVKIK